MGKLATENCRPCEEICYVPCLFHFLKNMQCCRLATHSTRRYDIKCNKLQKNMLLFESSFIQKSLPASKFCLLLLLHYPNFYDGLSTFHPIKMLEYEIFSAWLSHFSVPLTDARKNLQNIVKIRNRQVGGYLHVLLPSTAHSQHTTQTEIPARTWRHKFFPRLSDFIAFYSLTWSAKDEDQRKIHILCPNTSKKHA